MPKQPILSSFFTIKVILHFEKKIIMYMCIKIQKQKHIPLLWLFILSIVTTTDNDSAVKPTREHLYLKNTIYLSIEQQDGKLIYKKAYVGKARLQQNINTYNEGDSVFHLYGTDTVVVLPESNDTVIHCAVCGSSNNIADDKCRDCNHTLIKRI